MSPPSILGDAGREALAALRAGPALLAFDFDGTLAPIVDDPDAARADGEVDALMRGLCARAPVAVVTGRSAADARARLGFPPRWIVGNHGIEVERGDRPAPDGGGPGGPGELARARAQAADWLAALRAARLPDGVMLETKGASLSVHWRGAPDPDAARAAIDRAVSALSPAPEPIPGKCVLNLLPPGAPHKGQAIARLLADEGLERALFVGDDVTDELAFARAPAGWVTVRVGAETPTAARWLLPAQADIAALLRLLA